MIIISPGLVLQPSTAFPPWSPMIGWENVVTPTTITATSDDPAYPVTNLATPSTVEVWRAGSGATQYLTVTPPGLQAIDYIGVARHNFGSARIPVSVERFDGESWVEIVSPLLAGNDEPLIIRFEPGEGMPTRLRLDEGDAPATAAVVHAGPSLILPPHIQVGYTPINYGRRVDSEEDVSESGNFLGRPVFNEKRETTPRLSYIDGDWYRQNMDRFVAAAARRPFFFAWDPLHYPREVGYCWLRRGQVVEPVIHTALGHVQIDLPMRGIAA